MRATRTVVLLIVIFALIFVFLVAGVTSAEEPGEPLPVAQAAQPDYKAMYFEVLQRNLELETTLQQAIDLALGYRQDWEDQRDIAEARKLQADQTLRLADTLMAIIKDMKDTIDKQHEIIMRLTAPKRLGLQLIGGAVVYPREPTNPGVLFGLGWQF